MFGCDTNLTVVKDFSLAIISNGNAITCIVILLKKCEHLLLSGYMIGASTIKHQLVPPEEHVYKKEPSIGFMYPNLFRSFYVSHKNLGHPHTSFRPLVVWPNIQSNNSIKFIFHENIWCIKSMIIHVRSININIRSIGGMVSFFVVLLHLVRVGFGELDELFAIVVHPWIVLVSHLVPNVIFDVRPSCFQVCTSCILKFLIFNGILLLIKRLSLVYLLENLLTDGWILIKLIHHISTIILRCSHVSFTNSLTICSSLFTSSF
jgi:hypothetical protein